MTPDVRPFVAGNWKMNGLSGSLGEMEAMRRAVDAGEAGAAELAVCPPATLLAQAAWKLEGGKIALGAQDCAVEASGAFTGDISAPMLKDAGATYVIVGHSERRTLHLETNAARARQGGGRAQGGSHSDRLRRRDAGRARERPRKRGRLPPAAGVAAARGEPPIVVDIVVAYEPVWAIGTGLTPTPADVARMHEAIRTLLGEIYGPAGAKVRILYGGSVKPSNARELLGLDNVDGALVGGASLKAADFLAIAAAYR